MLVRLDYGVGASDVTTIKTEPSVRSSLNQYICRDAEQAEVKSLPFYPSGGGSNTPVKERVGIKIRNGRKHISLAELYAPRHQARSAGRSSDCPCPPPVPECLRRSGSPAFVSGHTGLPYH